MRRRRYVGLFPLLMRVLPADSPQLGALLAQLASRRELWTPHGLRSLSAASTLPQPAQHRARRALLARAHLDQHQLPGPRRPQALHTGAAALTLNRVQAGQPPPCMMGATRYHTV